MIENTLLGHDYFMRQALQEARYAYDKNEVPVGAIIVFDERIIARAHNLTESLNDVTAHAEMQAITMAANSLGGKYLAGCTLYVTLEPCPMCAGGLLWAQIPKVVYGASDEKRGAHNYNPCLYHKKTELIGGIIKEECESLLKEFFQSKRR